MMINQGMKKIFSVYGTAFFVMFVLELVLLYVYPKLELHLMLNSCHTDIQDTFFKYYSILAEWPLYILALLPLCWKKGRLTAFFAVSEIIGGTIAFILKQSIRCMRPVELFDDGILPLVKRGVINGKCKKLDRGKIVSTFVMGSQKIYNFIDGNPQVLMKDVEYTNDPFIIAQQPKMTSINSAIQVDLSGQVCADSLGDKIYSGVGGQIDFVYGASRAKYGKAIIAMPSTTRKGINKIVPALDLGSGAVTTRNHIHWFITEYGAVNLYGRSLQERAKLIISVAHPQFQDQLEEAAFKRFGSHYHYICKNNI
ncbi:MAG: hypothetical protein IIT56_11225 [Bacteroidales bacterium]|nr:hypothetical protein [Bacteroidales bacterium]